VADITVCGAGMQLVNQTDSFTNYSLNANSGYCHSQNDQLDWTGSNLTYDWATYIATRGTFTSFKLKDANCNELLQIKNLSYIIQLQRKHRKHHPGDRTDIAWQRLHTLWLSAVCSACSPLITTCWRLYVPSCSTRFRFHFVGYTGVQRHCRGWGG